MKRVALLVVCLAVVLGLGASLGFGFISAAGTFPDPIMEKVWNRTDLAVEQGKAARTWIWGPGAFDSRQEIYEQSPGGSRVVAYFDKSRMEINNPNGDRNSQWFVTNGLLTKELMTGKLQKGDNSFEDRAPADIPVAGDPDDANGPTYATLGKFLAPAGEVKAAVMATLDRAGNLGQNGALGNYTDYVYFVPETGHNIPRVFWDFLNSNGMVYDDGSYHQGKLFHPTFFATGFPITEAYWSQVKVGGEVKWVLIQAYERRVLTYTPDNQAGWKVEMGNIGRHYNTWRYSMAPTPTPTPTATPTPTTTPTPSPTATPQPTPKPEELARKLPLGGTWADNGQIILAAGSWRYERTIGDYYEAPSGWRFVVVSVAVKNTGLDELYVNPNYITLVDYTGREWEYDSSTYSFPDYFRSMHLQTGAQQNGTMVFVTYDSVYYKSLKFSSFDAEIELPIRYW